MATQTQYYNLDKPSYDEVADIEVINANFDKIDQQMRNNADGVNFAKAISSDAYDNSKLYAVGDYCIYENKLYRCITAIESAEAFNIEKWKQTTVGKEVKQLNSNLDTLEYSDIAGGKNLFDGKIIVGEGNYAYFELPKSNVHISISDRDINVDISNIYFGLSNAVVPNYDTMIWAFVNNGTIVGRDSNDFINSSFTAKSLSIYPNDANTVTKILQRFNIQIEEGDTATPYEPYIPSVKMLAEENAQQSTEAMDLKMLGWTVPSECPVQNYVDSDGVFHQRVGRVDLGSLEWERSSAGFFYSSEVENMPIPITGGKSGYCSVYGSFYVVSYQMITTQDKIITYSNSSITVKKNVCIRDTSYTDVTTFKNAMQDVYLYYELATPITMTIDGNEVVTQIKNDLSEQFNNRSYSGTLPECVSSVTKAIANGQSTTFNFIRENDSYYFGFVGRFTENLIGGLMTNSSGAVYKIGGSVESPTTTQM